MQSIMQEKKECFVCRSTHGLEKHHCIYGTGLRQLADKYGLIVWLCRRHHRGDIDGRQYAVHFNKVLDIKLKQAAQKAFTEKYPDKSFLKVFGKKYM